MTRSEAVQQVATAAIAAIWKATGRSAHRERQATGRRRPKPFPQEALFFPRPQNRHKRSYSAPELQGYRDTSHPAPAHTLKLGPIGARRVPAGLLFVQQKSKKGFIFRCFRRYQQAEKAARLQVVWSWHPLLMSSRRRRVSPTGF
jgi:hypothetical protein